MRVLFVGHCNDVYVGYLNQVVKQHYPQAKIGVVDLNYAGDGLKERSLKYDFVFNTKDSASGIKRSRLQSLSQIGWKKVVKNVVSLNFQQLKKELANLERSVKQVASFTKIISEFSPTLIHIHYLSMNNLRWIDVIPANCKVILTFWGSDLMTTPGGIEEYNVQYNALRRADVITTQTLDLRTILLSKFGQELLPKVTCQTFDPLSAKAKLIKEFSTDEARLALKLKYQISPDKLCIQVGYSSAEGQNHLKILHQIENLSKEHKDKITVFVPLSYSNKGDYVSSLLKEIKKLKIQIIPILEFVTDTAMLAIISTCEVFIAMRDNDALNAAMIESLYAGNIVITGSWLPYGIYQRKGVLFQQIDEISDLNEKLAWVIENKCDLKTQAGVNKNKLESIYTSSQIAEKWSKLYIQ